MTKQTMYHLHLSPALPSHKETGTARRQPGGPLARDGHRLDSIGRREPEAIMVCSVRAASVSTRRRRLFSSSPPTAPLAVLDLSQAGERQAQAVVRRLSSGRSAIWRLLSMARQGPTLLCAVRWRDPADSAAPYSLAEVSLTKPALCWRSYPTADAARQEMDRRCATVQATGEAP